MHHINYADQSKIYNAWRYVHPTWFRMAKIGIWELYWRRFFLSDSHERLGIDLLFIVFFSHLVFDRWIGHYEWLLYVLLRSTKAIKSGRFGVSLGWINIYIHMLSLSLSLSLSLCLSLSLSLCLSLSLYIYIYIYIYILETGESKVSQLLLNIPRFSNQYQSKTTLHRRIIINLST